MILFIILLGVYAILGVGFFKMVKNVVPFLVTELPLIVGIVSVIWPVAIVYSLVKEAVT